MKQYLSLIVIMCGWIIVDWFVGLDLKSLLVGVLSVLLYEPLKQKLNETR